MNTKLFRIAVVLGLLSAVGPFAIDMYLPALPSIGGDLAASPGAVQMTLLIFFLTIGFGQLLVGPLADMFGRKPPLYVGLAMFLAGSVGAALSPTVEWLILFRFVQGLGACAGMTVPRAIVRDLHTGTEAAKLMSMLMLVFSISPISMRKPRIFTWVSARPANSTTPSGSQRTRSPVRYRCVLSVPKRLGTKREADSSGRLR